MTLLDPLSLLDRAQPVSSKRGTKTGRLGVAKTIHHDILIVTTVAYMNSV